MRLRNIDIETMGKVSNWRKMSIGAWGPQSDPTVYAVIAQDCSTLLPYLEKINDQAPCKVTINHLVGKACSLLLTEFPQLNGIILRGKLFRRKTVDIFFQVDLLGTEAELSGVVIRECEKKTLIEISQELHEKATSLRKDRNSPTRKALKLFGNLPWFVVPALTHLAEFFQYSLNLNLEPFGIPRDTFGGLMINSIGSLGQEMAFAPLYSQSPGSRA